ncbi:hypothetical protein A3860_30985 [Niastella vici]|uniref:Lipoprotein n=1 Tax=Niastella vici TaxID=1703345 RepID=A0A1V9FU87_9BACT|nr:hypothetical protein [Niastella vici]OQP61891.1 hypothetical protein A3860_30985 [Niastella vici]
MHKLFLITIVALLFSCQNATKPQPVTVIDSSQKTPPRDTLSPNEVMTDEEQEQKRMAYEKQDNTYRIRESIILDHALTYANRNKNLHSFQHEFRMTPQDSSGIVTTQMIFGHLFAQNKKHLLIRRISSTQTFCSIYLLENENFKKVCEQEQIGSTHDEDSIKDVNGDQYKDFLVHWYPYSDCCRRHIVNVFLYKPNTGSFSRKFEFINPTFFPEEKIVRGLEFGKPGKIGLYKYKWNELTVDTLEFVYPDLNNPGKFIKTKTQTKNPTADDGTVLNGLPAEYKRIESIDWFLHY